ncbi:cytochrome c [Roseomonas sp. OT10]|uniref:c-type cytochrome n=1 Tax=Roseomonas cutis TaxID=2897332 RepID=UPI001E403364|nr:cytochrome c [Roseomonas sp. OT10]UFN47169.1 cytochrome c [Roseomonas sp. OT10]
MRSLGVAACFIALCCSLAAAQGLPPGATPAEAISQRKAGLREMQRNMEAIKAALDSRGDLAPVAQRAAAIQAFYTGFPSFFPAGSETGDTKARPEVWSDRATFERAAANAASAAGNLQAVAASGEASATATAFQQMAASCSACHRNFRAR